MKVVADGYVHHGQHVYRLHGRTIFRRPFLQGVQGVMQEAWLSSIDLPIPDCVKTHFKLA